jgi:hypothetical protein
MSQFAEKSALASVGQSVVAGYIQHSQRLSRRPLRALRASRMPCRRRRGVDNRCPTPLPDAERYTRKPTYLQAKQTQMQEVRQYPQPDSNR